MFFILTKIKNAMINMLYTIFTYKDKGGYIDSSLGEALTTEVFLDLYIHNFHYKPLYICIMVK